MKKILIALAVSLAPALFAASPSFPQVTNIANYRIAHSGLVTNNTAGAINLATNSTLTSSNIVATGTFTGSGSGLTGVKVADTNITGTITVTNNLASISPAVPNVVLTGNGSPSPNGTYIYTGSLNGGNLYQNGTNWFIFWYPTGNVWLIANATTGFTKDWYAAGSISNPPLNTAFGQDLGTTGAPIIIPADVLSVNGQMSITNNLSVGGTVTASGFAAGASNGISAVIPVSGTNWIFTAGLLTGHTP